ncbi:reverse transcriptase domain-containing protein [Tanacetum coccineum]
MEKFETPPDSSPVIVIDPDDQPMWSSTRTVDPTPSFAIIQLPISDNFHIKGLFFSRYPRTNDLLNELDEGTITSWNELREAFIRRYFYSTKFRRLLNEIHIFHQFDNESLVDAWLRLKEMLRTCYGHGLTKGTIIQTLCRGLDVATKGILGAGGIFLYNTPNEAFKILEDKVLLKLNFSGKSQNRPKLKTVVFFGGNNINLDHSILMEKFKALATKIDSEFLIIGKELKKM